MRTSRKKNQKTYPYRSEGSFFWIQISINTLVVCTFVCADNCGNGKSANQATLSSPKGLTIDSSGRLYFVDGATIRTVDPITNIISTFAGRLSATGTRPVPCQRSISLEQVRLFLQVINE